MTNVNNYRCIKYINICTCTCTCVHVHVDVYLKFYFLFFLFLDIPKLPPIELTALESHVSRLQDEDLARDEFIVKKYFVSLKHDL